MAVDFAVFPVLSSFQNVSREKYEGYKMSEKRKKIVSLLLVFSLVVFSGNLTAQQSWVGAQEKKGAKLKVEKNNGQQVTGELIAVKEGSLLLLDSETISDLSVDIKDIKAITMVKKSLGFQFMVYGALAGVLYGSSKRKTFLYEDRSQPYFEVGAALAGTGLVIGTVLGINKRIQIQGKSDADIQETLEKLNKKARVPGMMN